MMMNDDFDWQHKCDDVDVDDDGDGDADADDPTIVVSETFPNV